MQFIFLLFLIIGSAIALNTTSALSIVPSTSIDIVNSKKVIVIHSSTPTNALATVVAESSYTVLLALAHKTMKLGQFLWTLADEWQLEIGLGKLQWKRLILDESQVPMRSLLPTITLPVGHMLLSLAMLLQRDHWALKIFGVAYALLKWESHSFESSLTTSIPLSSNAQ